MLYYRLGRIHCLPNAARKMTNYNFIGIGINNYQYLQPLSYAQADIQGLDDFLRETVRLHPEKTLTFTDNSPWVDEQATYPNRANLLRWIQQGFHGTKKTQPYGSSVLWFVFSGYGIQYEGEDYLLPVDGKLQDPLGSGIPIRKVFEALQQQGAAKVIALLDMNRSTMAMGNGTLGTHTLNLAAQMGIATVLSCKPEEFSHETSALGHGMFTAAVLEALRYYRTDLTLELLNQYLGDRLKELSDHHWRPVQTPVMVIPSLAASRELILPTGEATTIRWQTAVPVGASLAMMNGDTVNGDRLDLDLPPLRNGQGQSSYLVMGKETTEASVGKHQALEVEPFGEEPEIYRDFGAESHEAVEPLLPLSEDEPETALFTEGTEVEPDPTQPVVMPTSLGTTAGNRGDRPWYLAGWQWLSLLLFILCGSLGWRLFGKQTPQPSTTQPEMTEVIATGYNAESTPENVPPQTQAPDNDQPTAANPTTTPQPPQNPQSSPTPPPAGQSTPPVTQPPTTPPPTTPTNGTQPTAQESLLTANNAVLRSNQASSFSQAIAAARAIKPGDPLHREAQTQINRWSRVILDIAEARAVRGDFVGAIAAARLVPTDVPEVYRLAQTAIKTWQSQITVAQKNRQAIANAQELIVPFQASSYSRAIHTLKLSVKPKDPLYREARNLQDQWSRTIYLLANSRAAKKQFKLAVETAKLVPADSPTYKPAQGAIAKWQKSVR